MQPIKFIDVGLQYAALREEILEKIDEISGRGEYILGGELERFEKNWAGYCGTRFAIGVANGSDALMLALLGLGIGPGDEVISAPNSFVATAWAIERTGARVVFCDVGADMNLDPALIATKITPRTRAIMPVHLTGRIADMDPINALAEKHGLIVIEDAAPAAGATYKGRKAGSMSRAAGFSLHPTKNLHVAGDGGIITTNDPELDATLRIYRNHGLRNRDECAFWGINSRLDCIHAGIANLKLKYLDGWNARFRKIAQYYTDTLQGLVTTPVLQDHEKPTFHRYMLQHPERDRLQAFLTEHGVDTRVNYPIPLHLQPAAKDLGHKPGDFPETERLAATILSLPLYAELTDAHVEYVAGRVRAFFGR